MRYGRMEIVTSNQVETPPAGTVDTFKDATDGMYKSKLPSGNVDVIGGGDEGYIDILNMTYAEFETAIAASELLVGMNYRITDFRTIHEIPETVDTFEGAIEPLIVLAVKNDDILNNAISEQYPQDIIKYAWDSIGFGADRGRIYYREDTINNNSFPADFRNINFRRWATVGAPAVYTEFTDNGQASSDFYPFGDNCKNNLIKAVDNSNFLNIVLKDACDGNIIENSNKITIGNTNLRNKIGAGCSDIIFGDTVADNIIKGTSSQITLNTNAIENEIGFDNIDIFLGVNTSDNKIGNGNDNCQIDSQCKSNKIENGTTNVRLKNSCEYNTIRDKCRDIELSDEANVNDIRAFCNRITLATDCQANLFREWCQDIELDVECQNNEFGDFCREIIFGESCSSNIFSQVCIDIEFGVDCSYNTLRGGCNVIFFGDDCSRNTFGTRCSAIDFTDDCSDNYFENNCSNIEFEVACNRNTFNVGVYDIVFGDDCSSNKFLSNVHNINIGNECEMLLFEQGVNSIDMGLECLNIKLEARVRNLTIPNNTELRRESLYDGEQLLTYNFAENGGVIGDIQLGSIPLDSYINFVNYNNKAVFASAGAATVSLGIIIDDVDGIQSVLAFNDAKYNGSIQVGDVNITDPATYTIKTTLNRDIIMSIGVANLTGGVLELLIKYNKTL